MKEETVNFFKDPAVIRANEAEERRRAVEAFIAKGGQVKIGVAKPIPRKMTANP